MTEKYSKLLKFLYDQCNEYCIKGVIKIPTAKSLGYLIEKRHPELMEKKEIVMKSSGGNDLSKFTALDIIHFYSTVLYTAHDEIGGLSIAQIHHIAKSRDDIMNVKEIKSKVIPK